MSFSLTNAQETVETEQEMKAKADTYFNAWDNGDAVGLTKNDKICIAVCDEKPEVDYCVLRAYSYYKELIEKYPESKDYTSYLYKIGIMAIELNKLEEGNNSLLKVVEINTSNYYSKLSLYHLTRSAGSNCELAKNYVSQQKKLHSDLLNEYQNSYIEDENERVNRLCSK